MSYTTSIRYRYCDYYRQCKSNFRGFGGRCRYHHGSEVRSACLVAGYRVDPLVGGVYPGVNLKEGHNYDE